MRMTLDQIVEETRQLPSDVVAELVDRILAAHHGGVEEGISLDWKNEFRRRIAEIESGQVIGVPGDDVTARVRKSLGR